ncbi:MAG: 23S rRNA (pseudouridine(1915)-N(3))-methyltransferase RlmH [Oligoflexia bacterium]|nr:23S rRNA (pseudouridine(1915)-N(3))-methyltransferase RlmH [Oligoflexia bacterium]
MKIRIFSLGRVKSAFVTEGVGEYLKRLRPWCQCEFEQLDTGRFGALAPEQQKKKEAELLRKHIESSDFLALLEPTGKQFSTTSFSAWVRKRQEAAAKQLIFAIGGPHGWDAELLEESKAQIALSSLTFTSELALVVLAEQLYRAFSIIKGHPYSK